MDRYCRRLIEVDLPIKRISEHARREKSIRHGHISTLHIWWARRPLAACRAVICAALWPDPVDVTESDVEEAKKQGRNLQLNTCPPAFREKAKALMIEWATRHLSRVSPESYPRFNAIAQNPRKLDDAIELRGALLDFIADFANWDNCTVQEFLDTSRALTQSAHEALGGAPGTKPLIVDSFAGGGSIPLEALRVGADAFASDLNPVAVLLNKVALEYIPKYGRQLADEVRKWGQWVKEEAEKELVEFYPKDPDGATPIAYLWARTIQCEGPGCGTEVPLIRSLWLAKKANHSVALQLMGRRGAKHVDFRIIVKQHGGWVDQEDPEAKIEQPQFNGTVKRGSATCPCCGYTTSPDRLREQLTLRRGGTDDARLFCVVTTKHGEQRRQFRLPNERDHRALRKAAEALESRQQAHVGQLSLVPEEPTEQYHSFVNRGPIYGMNTWGDFFTRRQQLALITLVRLISDISAQIGATPDAVFSEAVQTCLALVVDRVADRCSSLCRYDPSPTMSGINNTFARQALPMVWDFGEGDPTSERSGGWDQCLGWLLAVLQRESSSRLHQGTSQQASATQHPLPDDSCQSLVTDPPYYYSVQYADLSDFFYVWLRRSLEGHHCDLLKPQLTEKQDEIIVQSPGHEFKASGKNNAFYESRMKAAMLEGRRVLSPDGVGVIVFAHKSTAGWEAQLQAMIDAGWIVSGSWPIDTEMATRVLAQGRAVLASSVHLVCRPRENPDGSLITDRVGDWRDVLSELPASIHEWMPRLAQEGVVGADAIFACLGPALEVFSRYSSVEKTSGEKVTLNEYLEHIWAAVAREALTMIFESADASGFEEDARLTAMWLWTLRTFANGNGNKDQVEDEEEDEAEGKAKRVAGYALEYDAARKIAQGLGAHLERLGHLVEVRGDTATLLPAGARTKHLFGKDAIEATRPKRKREGRQLAFDLGEELKVVEEESGIWPGDLHAEPGDTVLDQLHQSMILFGAGRGEALKRLLVNDGVGQNPLFWRLAQSLAALYPPGSDEKRWVDGVLARKKALGL